MMTLTVLLIAFFPAALVFILCMLSSSKAVSVVIGVVGCAIVSSLGAHRYRVLDMIFIGITALLSIGLM
jgi:hypothetical protein